MITQPTVPAGADGTDPSAATARRADTPVSRSLILQSALRIIDRDGVDGLSMRRLSDEVGRDPTVLYRHVPNKAAVLDGVAESVIGQLHVDTADTDWATQLRTVALTELQEVVERPEETDDVLRLGLHRLTITEFSQVRALASALAAYDGAAELDRALDLLLIGLTATLTGADASPSSTSDGPCAGLRGPRSGGFHRRRYRGDRDQPIVVGERAETQEVAVEGKSHPSAVPAARVQRYVPS